jgi:hypothetical protein
MNGYELKNGLSIKITFFYTIGFSKRNIIFNNSVLPLLNLILNYMERPYKG